jgi:hypothetical protein
MPRRCGDTEKARHGDTETRRRSSGYGGEEGELVSIFQDMIRRTMLTIDNPEDPDRSGDVQGLYDVINGRAFRKSGDLFIRAELAERCKKSDGDVHK